MKPSKKSVPGVVMDAAEAAERFAALMEFVMNGGTMHLSLRGTPGPHPITSLADLEAATNAMMNERDRWRPNWVERQLVAQHNKELEKLNGRGKKLEGHIPPRDQQ